MTVRPARSRTLLLVAAVCASALLAGCTPAQFQAWWTARGNPPMKEPELSRHAAAATRYWAEVARKKRFSYSVRTIDSALANRMTPSSWRPGCPVPLSSLRYVRLAYMDMGGGERVGEMVVHADAVSHTVMAFKVLWDHRFPIANMRLVDDYGGDDDASMAANNTSAFNCRRVAGSSTWSQHSYGRAIDINPVQNPYLFGGRVLPPLGSRYRDRSRPRKGMVRSGDVVVRAFASVGWRWGGVWRSPDYQHFDRP